MKRLGVLTAVLITSAACLDLDVTNLNQPDRERALGDPEGLQSLIAGTFNVWMSGVGHGNFHVLAAFAPTGIHTSSGSAPNVSDVWGFAQEPREAFNNSADIPGTVGPHGPRVLWSNLLEIQSSTQIGLSALTDPELDMDPEVAPMAEAFSRLMLGWTWGTLATVFDQSFFIPAEDEIPASVEEAMQHLRPWEEGLAMALDMLESAAQVASANTFTLPSRAQDLSWLGAPTPTTSAELAQLANTLAARFAVQSSRTKEQRASLDHVPGGWNRVLDLLDGAITSDFEVVLDDDRGSTYIGLVQTGSSSFCGASTGCYRLDQRLIGRADATDAWPTWAQRAIDGDPERDRFDITTSDRRITGDSPTGHGAYTRYRSDNIGFARALYIRSGYQWNRHSHEVDPADVATASSEGTATIASVDEVNLTRAEAILRTQGITQDAVDLINISRTRDRQMPDGSVAPGLPALTTEGVPDSGGLLDPLLGLTDCAPRLDNGDCGDVMTALWYERMIELIGLSHIRDYADARGFGLLPDGTWLQQPVPGNELDVLELAPYTFGGNAGSAAVYGPATDADIF